MASRISGITIAINADTSGVTSGLKDLTTDSVELAKQLKSVEQLLKMDPSNTEVLALKQDLLAKAADTSAKKLEALKAAQGDVERAFANGDLGTDEYIAFQRELSSTEKRLEELGKQSENTSGDVDDLGTETEQTGNQMQDADKKSSNFGETLKNGIAVGAQAAAAALAATTAAVTATVGAIVSATSETAEYGDNVDKMSQKLGISAEKYQEWDFVMQHSGSDIDKMTTSMKKLADAVEEPTDKSTAAFEKLGISMEQAKNMSQEDLFAATISALQKMESGTERTALANDLLGKSAMDLGALLNTSAEDTEAMMQQVHDLGGVMSDDAVKASAAYQDSLQNVKTAISGVGRNIGTSFMPAITEMMDGFSALLTGNDKAIEGLESGFKKFIDNAEKTADKIAEAAEKFIPIIIQTITKNLPKMVNSAMRIVKTLAEAIMKNLPMIISTAGQIILELSQSLLRSLPQIVRVGLQVIVQLANGIADALPEMIPTIVEVVMEIVDVLTDPNTLGALIDAAIAIIFALTDGLIQSLPIMIERLPEIIENISETLIDNIPKLMDASWEIIKKLAEFLTDTQNLKKIGKAAFEIVKKLAEGIVGALWKIAETATKIAKEFVEKIKDFDFVQAGKDLINSFMNGVVDAWNSWSNWWQGVGESIYDYLNPEENNQPQITISGHSRGGSYSRYAMAEGGIVTRPTRALIGENGVEAVIPLENNTGWADRLAELIGGRSVVYQFGDIYVQGGADAGRDFIRQIDSALRQYQIEQQRGIGGRV
ncbi:MAG: phage tail tape measure protein [Bacteroidaceae bacterium]|nr:phage tail tape measure protein [Bacteroidaceae bacterium]